MRKWFSLFILPLLLACTFATTDWKTIDLGSFKLLTPRKWEYKSQKGIDSFIGQIFISTQKSLSFDYSSMGYANTLLPSQDEYIIGEEWKRGCYFCKPGVTYTARFNVKNEKDAQMKKSGITDSTLIKVEAYPDYETKQTISEPTKEERIKYPKANYIAQLTYKDSTIYIPIEIPAVIKSHNISFDSTDKYVVKTIWPKVAGKGMTGIYVKSKTSTLNFKMSAYNLSKKQQDDALKAFKTIKIKGELVNP